MKKRSQVTNLKSTVNWTKVSTRSHKPTSRIVAAVKIRVRKETCQFLTAVIFRHCDYNVWNSVEECLTSLNFKISWHSSTTVSLLKSYLTGYVAQLISHLTLEEANYEVAIKLTEEFLDIPLIVDEIFKQLLDASPKYDTNFINVKQFLSETRAELSELRTLYNLDFFEEERPGFRIISHIVFAKLPSILQRVLVHKVGTNYPIIKDIFDNYNESIKTLIKTSIKNNFNPERNNDNPSKEKNNNPKAESKNVSAIENFTTRADSIPSCCKLCKKEGHPMSRCSTYASAQTR